MRILLETFICQELINNYESFSNHIDSVYTLDVTHSHGWALGGRVTRPGPHPSWRPPAGCPSGRGSWTRSRWPSPAPRSLSLLCPGNKSLSRNDVTLAVVLHLSTANNSSCVSHPPARGRGHSGDEGYHGLGVGSLSQ